MKNVTHLPRIILAVTVTLAVLAGLLANPKAPALAQRPSAIPTKMSNTTIGISAANSSVNPGDAFEISVTVDSDTPSRAAQCEITFDPQLVEVTGVSEGTFYKQWAQANSASSVMVPPKPVADNVKGRLPQVGVSLVGSPGNGPTGSGTLIIVHLKAKASGTVNFNLENLEIDDTGDASGRVQALGGVKVQNGVVAIGAGGAAPAQPTAQPVAAATAPAAASPVAAPTIARRQTANSEGSGIPWEIILPALGALIIGGVFVVTTRRKK